MQTSNALDAQYSQKFYYFFPFITIIVAVIYHPVILMDSLLLEI